jgi:hypothetical protein
MVKLEEMFLVKIETKDLKQLLTQNQNQTLVTNLQVKVKENQEKLVLKKIKMVKVQ